MTFRRESARFEKNNYLCAINQKLMENQKNHVRLTEEEIQEMTKDIADDPETEEETEVPLTGNPMFDRWASDDASINECGHL